MKHSVKFHNLKLIVLFLILASSNELFSQNFTSSVFNFEGSSEGVVTWVDINGDDYLDLFVSGGTTTNTQAFCTFYLNQHGNNFISSNIFFPPVSHGTADWGDFDNDGDLDLLLVGTIDSGGNNLICNIYQNNMPNGFSIVPANLKGIYKGVAKWIDYDNDGDLDIFASGLDQSQHVTAEIYDNKNGSFSPISHSIIPLYGGSGIICDIDKDQDMDIIMTGKKGISVNSAPESKVFLNTSKGTFLTKDIGLPAVYNSHLAWGDYNGDGNSDILLNGVKEIVTNQGSTTNSITRLYKNNGNFSFSNTNINITGIHNGIGIWADCNNDGKLDILLSGEAFSEKSTNPSSKVTKVYLNHSNSFTELTTSSFTRLSNTSASWGDFDNDYDLDILINGTNDKNVDITMIYINNNDVPNNVPVEPKGLTTSIDHGFDSNIFLQWLPGMDDNTPTKSLTYNLRVGTTPGGFDIISPKSNPETGYMKIPSRGNVDNNTSWRLNNLRKGTYYWSVQTIDNSFSGSDFSAEQTFTIKGSVGISQISSILPDKFDLEQNYPNPFNPSTKIRYALPGSSNVVLTVYNASGQKISELVNQTQNGGTYEVSWNGDSESGNVLSSGIYFYTIDTKFGRDSRKMLLIK